jgi:hypothetical protein
MARLHRRLILALGPDEVLPDLLADLAMSHSGDVDLAEVDTLVEKWGPEHTPPTAALLHLMRPDDPGIL